MARLMVDLRFSVRSLWCTPGHSLAIVTLLTLGIGANAAVFSALDQLVLRPLPYAEADRLAKLWEDFSAFGAPKQRVSPANYLDWQRRAGALADLAAYRVAGGNLSGGGVPEDVTGIAATANLLPMLGASPVAGRLFTPADDHPDSRIVVISSSLWQRRFGGAPGAVGATLTLNGVPYIVIGVMPRTFRFPDATTEYWMPLGLTPELASRRNSHFLHVVGRLAAGRTWFDARAEMNAIANALAAEYPATNARTGIRIVPLKEELLAGSDQSILILLAAAGCVLLIACANAANLVLVRSSARRHELAVRLALGASRTAIARGVFLETLVLASISVAGALVVATWTIGALAWLVPPGMAERALAIDGRVIAFAAVIAVLTSLACGLAPALSMSAGDLLPSLSSGGARVSGASGQRVRDWLVVGEIALALVLLVAAGLLIETLATLRARDPGFRHEHVLTAAIAVPLPKYADGAARARFYNDVIARVSAVPGVGSVGLTSDLPYTSRGNTMSVAVERDDSLVPGRDALFRLVSNGYLETIGARLRAGRFLGESDGPDAPPVVVINEAFAKQYFPGANPLGHRIDTGTGTRERIWMTIVGIVADIRERGVEAGPKAAVYVPFAQTAISFFQPAEIAIRTRVPPLSLTGELQRAVWSVDPEQPISNIRTLEEIVDGDLAGRHDVLRLLGAFAALALVLATLGVYAVLSWVVLQSRRDLGIRVALGASPAVVTRTVVGYAGRLAAAGIALGLAASLAMARFFSAFLVEVSPLDVRALSAASVVLATAAVAAAYVPARRAASTDPILSLRTAE